MTETRTEAGAQRRLKLRERLLDVARQAVATRGLTGLKARDLASEAGCALGAIYTAFDDLDELILRVNLATLDRLGQALDAALGAADPSDALLALARAYLDFARREEPSWRALFEHRLSGGAAVPDWYADARNRLFGRLEAPLAELLPRQDAESRARLARTLFSAVHGVVALGLEEKLEATTPEALDTQLETLVRLIAAGLAREAEAV
ncbi:TetR/AcrR family transcriptional regulator [Methylocystis parvus]|uniref:TetR/AcrR family transcriptional regulator n=1 Tax=Methylocystis parvus TaxID=134 RepID=A0A6B8M4B8_9HYPH|nr:TetR/AcrR family transcriptional regulator [Methylocystis parvus]QGM97188.1 TetR/AcrR family transcriptional regulator [Methylocystis parvus]WBJ98908.1 TetR/AcrR family transcriptional regulator [Methylocystis parvus OBBP]